MGPLVRLCLVSRVYLHLPDLICAMLLISVLWFLFLFLFCVRGFFVLRYQSTLGKLTFKLPLSEENIPGPHPRCVGSPSVHMP